MKHTKGFYWDGFVDGLCAYAWWKDGIEYVGSCGTKLTDAIRNAQNLAYYTEQKDGLSRTAPHHCDDPDCPGGQNRRKLEAAEEIAEALKGLIGQIQNGFYRPTLEKYDKAYEGGRAFGSALETLARWEEKP